MIKKIRSFCVIIREFLNGPKEKHWHSYPLLHIKYTLIGEYIPWFSFLVCITPTQDDSFSSSIHLPGSQVAISQKTGNQSTKKHSIFPKDAQPYYKDICSTMFIKVLFVIDRTSKQPRCPSTDELINKMCYIHTIAYQSNYFTL